MNEKPKENATGEIAKIIGAGVLTLIVMAGGWFGYRQMHASANESSVEGTAEAVTKPSSATETIDEISVSAPDTATPHTDPAHWEMTFADEFDGKWLDFRRWLDSYPGGVRTHSNNEQQFYSPDAVTSSGGKLTFTALRRNKGGKPFTSGMISSHGRFAQQYGWFEIRTRIPAGQGMWPAFWLLPENRNWPPEIDIMEILGHEPGKMYMSNHWADDKNKHQHQTQGFSGPDFSKDFHVFAICWKPKEMIWYVDGKERSRSANNVPQVPMFVLANLAVGGDWPGMPDISTPFPGKMEIDYIRVYKEKGR